LSQTNLNTKEKISYLHYVIVQQDHAQVIRRLNDIQPKGCVRKVWPSHTNSNTIDCHYTFPNTKCITSLKMY